ncbi:MAG: hypothetical protein ACREXY_21540 [Gammaproteobacteria bacterium]
MARLRKSCGADFKAKVAIAAIKAEATTVSLRLNRSSVSHAAAL